jgi:hypothetical protein
MIRTGGFPASCNTTTLSNFGGHYGGEEQNTVEQILEFLKTHIVDGQYYVASTTYGQRNAAKALKKFGFKSSTWNRVGWSKSKARIWWYCQNCPDKGNNY